MGIIKTTSFNWLTESHLLVYFLASVISAPYHKLGFFPLLKFPQSPSPAKLLESFEDVKLDLPEVRGVDDKVLRDLRFTLDVTKEREITGAYGMIGRSTVVVPLKADPTSTTATSLCGNEDVVAKIRGLYAPKTQRTLRMVTSEPFG